jgi:hypothetical protein
MVIALCLMGKDVIYVYGSIGGSSLCLKITIVLLLLYIVMDLQADKEI